MNQFEVLIKFPLSDFSRDNSKLILAKKRNRSGYNLKTCVVIKSLLSNAILVYCTIF
ncbi:hypothetical protein CKA32_000642 [Geitlerinema sp. FC II]|nr:hypothetical protein CKA32_000642 [Geitlerinema sp. FC II]